MIIKMLLVTAVFLASMAAHAGSIDDGFAALDKGKGGAKATGIDAGFGALEKRGGKATGIDAGFGSLDQGRSDAATGHGIDTGFKDVETQRAAQQAQQARVQRLRMEQEAQKNEQDMQEKCRCVYSNCPSNTIQLVALCSDGAYPAHSDAGRSFCGRETREQNIRNDASYRQEQAQNRAAAAEAAQARKTVCDAWKAAGPRANTESFKAQLRQQDNAIAAAQRVADESARQRDALIAQDVKRVQATTANAEQAQRVADDNAANSAAAREKARVAANQAEQEAKLHKWCMMQADLSDCACAKYNPHPKKGTACRH